MCLQNPLLNLHDGTRVKRLLVLLWKQFWCHRIPLQSSQRCFENHCFVSSVGKCNHRLYKILSLFLKKFVMDSAARNFEGLSYSLLFHCWYNKATKTLWDCEVQTVVLTRSDFSPRRHWAMCGEMSVCHTGKEWMETREALDFLQGTTQTPPQRPNCPRRSIVLRLRNRKLKNFCAINIYAFLEPASPNILHLSEALVNSFATCLKVPVPIMWQLFNIFLWKRYLLFSKLFLTLIKDSCIWSPFWLAYIILCPYTICLLFCHCQLFKCFFFLITVSQLTFEVWFGY